MVDDPITFQISADLIQIMAQGTTLRLLASGSLAMLLLGLNWRPPWLRKSRSSKSDASTLSSIVEMGDAITAASSNPTELAELAFQETTRFMDADFFQLGLFEGDSFRTLIQVRDGKRLENVRVPTDFSNLNIVVCVREQQCSLLLEDADSQSNDYLEALGYETIDPPLSA
ncbi:MAG: hypothetical protein PVI78_05740, partial [Anaerolineales bacterium]